MPQHQEEQELEPVAQTPSDVDELFVDHDFPADSSFLTEDAPKDVEWRRPHELHDEPQMFVDGPSRLDVIQGYLGNCWSMAACAALAEHTELVRQIVPDGQILHGPGYTGRIIIRLWHMNSWRDVEIDDRLPVQSDELIYARCSSNNEFWIPLLEKALAKFHGGYQNLCGGLLPEGFVSLTGYSVRLLFIENYKSNKNNLFRLLSTEMKNESLIACARGGQFERGLPDYHGYTVTGVSHLRTDQHHVRLIRLRNPWGDDEWNGKWRDDHDVWKELGPEVLHQMDFNLKIQRDGEFWMKLVDFIKYFEELCIASRLPLVHGDQVLPATDVKLIRCSWTENTAGGPWGSETFYLNPQVLLSIEEESLEEITAYESNEAQKQENGEISEEEINGNCQAASSLDNCIEVPQCKEKGLPVLIELLQDHNRRFGTELHTIGFHIFKIDKPEVHLEGEEQRWTHEQLEHQSKLMPSEPDESLSSVHGYYHLIPGMRYVVLPCTKEPGQCRRFLLRVYGRHVHIHLRHLGDGDDASALAEPNGPSRLATETELSC